MYRRLPRDQNQLNASGLHYKVWVQIEEIDWDPERYEIVDEGPLEIAEFRSIEEARAFKDQLLGVKWQTNLELLLVSEKPGVPEEDTSA